jgi:anthranilate synthase component 2
VQYLGELGAETKVFRNDEIPVNDIEAMSLSHIVISPGPCTPNEAGITLPLIERMAGKVPILGVCLGHQAIGQAFGGKVVRARQVMHGKVSRVRHDGSGVFSGIPNEFVATRYHSLVVERATLPECLAVTAQSEDGEIMGLRHRSLRVEGVQFHPEALLTEHGHKMLQNFIEGKTEGERRP